MENDDEDDDDEEAIDMEKFEESGMLEMQDEVSFFNLPTQNVCRFNFTGVAQKLFRRVLYTFSFFLFYFHTLLISLFTLLNHLLFYHSPSLFSLVSTFNV